MTEVGFLSGGPRLRGGSLGGVVCLLVDGVALFVPFGLVGYRDLGGVGSVKVTAGNSGLVSVWGGGEG
jgi:hypothetical protein